MSNEVLTQYKRYRARNRRFISAMVLLLAVTGIVSLIIGSHRIGWQELWAIVQNEGTEMNRQILLNIRLPRMLAAVITGIILSLSGAIMQILLRNPLASPYTLGISNAAGITRSSDLFMITNPYVITLSAFLGSLLGLAIILIIIRGKQASVETIILSGVIINSLFGAGIAVMQYVANNVQLASIVFWNFGDLGRSDWSKLLFLIVALIPALIYFYLKRWDYKVLCSGDDYAQSIIVFRRVDHKGRIGDNEEFLIPGSAIFGGMFLLLCDTVARTILSPIILPVGILTSFLGVPLFLFLLTRKKKITQ